MALAYRTGSFVSAGNGSGGDLTLNRPTGTADGDIIVLPMSVLPPPLVARSATATSLMWGCGRSALNTLIVATRPPLQAVRGQFVEPRVLTLRHQLQVADVVVLRVAINMMNHFGIEQRATKMLFDHNAMLEFIRARSNTNSHITRASCPPPAAPVDMQFANTGLAETWSATEPTIALHNHIWPRPKRRAAGFADALNRRDVRLPWHGNLQFLCRAGGVRSTARRFCVSDYISIGGTGRWR